MDTHLFHIFRNTPFGRETFFQSLYFCKNIGASPVVYIPKHTKFLMYFDNDVVQVDLDDSYLTAPNSARSRAEALAEEVGITPEYYTPKHFTASTLPDIKTDFDFMCCPRSVSDLSSKIGLGYIGPRVRRIVRSARFPVLITSPVFKPWQRLSVFFGGSTNALNAVRLGLRLARITGKPLDMFTQLESGKSEDHYRDIIAKDGLTDHVAEKVNHWQFFDDPAFNENLYAVSHDSLVILGAFGHGVIRDFVFGSKMEMIQSTIVNPMLIAGPKYTAEQ